MKRIDKIEPGFYETRLRKGEPLKPVSIFLDKSQPERGERLVCYVGSERYTGDLIALWPSLKPVDAERYHILLSSASQAPMGHNQPVDESDALSLAYAVKRCRMKIKELEARIKDETAPLQRTIEDIKKSYEGELSDEKAELSDYQRMLDETVTQAVDDPQGLINIRVRCDRKPDMVAIAKDQPEQASSIPGVKLVPVVVDADKLPDMYVQYSKKVIVT